MIGRWMTSTLLTVVLAAPAASDDSLVKDPRVADALHLLGVWADAERAYEGIPGVSLAVVHDQDVLWSRGFGLADRETERPATPQTKYSICSISKLFTSIAVLQLRDEGRLRLDDPIAKHLPWFDLEQTYDGAPPITVRGLLTHSSGLPRESDHAYWTYPDWEFPTREAIVERLKAQSTLYPEGRYFQYSNLGLTLAGEIVSAVSGRPYAEYVKGHILDPLGLHDTTPEIPVEEWGGRFATGYSGRSREGQREKLKIFQARGIAPAAGFASTVLDLARFASWQFRLLDDGDKEVLDAYTLGEMHRVHWVDPDWETTWGLGFSVNRVGDKTFVGHGGACPGFRSNLRLQTKEKLASVVMTNARDADAGDFTRVAYALVAPAVAEALASPGKGKPPAPELEKYTGAYGTGWGGETAVVPWKGGLAMVRLPAADPAESLIELKHVDGGVFRRVREDGELGEPIVFEEEDGRVVRFVRHSNRYPRMSREP